MTREEVKNKVIKIIFDKIGFSQSEIKESTRFKYDIGTDSLDDIELLIEFERVFGIKIPDEEISTICTVGEAIDGICQKVGVSICKKQQPKMDLEKEIEEQFDRVSDGAEHVPVANLLRPTFARIARHFYELGLNARKQ